MNVQDFYSGVDSPEKIKQVCSQHSKELDWSFTTVIDPEDFLLSLSGVETSFGRNCVPRYEQSYGPNGFYAKNPMLALMLKKYGALAACSYGPWQIMAIVAREHGFEGHPLELHRAETSCPVIIRKINRIISKGAKSIEQILDAYNTGSFQIGAPPEKYISQFWDCFKLLKTGKILKEGVANV